MWRAFPLSRFGCSSSLCCEAWLYGTNLRPPVLRRLARLILVQSQYLGDGREVHEISIANRGGDDTRDMAVGCFCLGHLGRGIEIDAQDTIEVGPALVRGHIEDALGLGSGEDESEDGKGGSQGQQQGHANGLARRPCHLCQGQHWCSAAVTSCEPHP